LLHDEVIAHAAPDTLSIDELIQAEAVIRIVQEHAELEARMDAETALKKVLALD